jgi:hypothetical protein
MPIQFPLDSREKGLQDILLHPGLSKTGCLVRNLALSLPRRRLAIYLDNYFTSVPLFKELRACEFGAMGTTRHRTEDFCTRVRKRPAKTLTNGRIVRKVFEEASTKELQIPCFIDDYNQYIGDVDLANQFRESYETHRITQRNLWPLLYWLIDVACINVYRLYQLHITDTRPLTHLQFRTELYCKLFGYSEKAKLRSLQV